MDPEHNLPASPESSSPAPEAPRSKKEWALTKSWQYLLYLYLLLPSVLFLLAFLLKNTSFGVSLAAMFHNYGLFVTNPIPNFAAFNFTGVIGIGRALFFVGWAVKRKNWVDLVLSLALIALNFSYFFFGWNYQLARLLRFTSDLGLFF